MSTPSREKLPADGSESNAQVRERLRKDGCIQQQDGRTKEVSPFPIIQRTGDDLPEPSLPQFIAPRSRALDSDWIVFSVKNRFRHLANDQMRPPSRDLIEQIELLESEKATYMREATRSRSARLVVTIVPSFWARTAGRVIPT